MQCHDEARLLLSYARRKHLAVGVLLASEEVVWFRPIRFGHKCEESVAVEFWVGIDVANPPGQSALTFIRLMDVCAVFGGDEEHEAKEIPAAVRQACLLYWDAASGRTWNKGDAFLVTSPVVLEADGPTGSPGVLVAQRGERLVVLRGTSRDTETVWVASETFARVPMPEQVLDSHTHRIDGGSSGCDHGLAC